MFRAWTDPDELKRWWGPGQFTTPHTEVDLRPGGRYLLVMQPSDGTPLRVAGTYREVLPPERLVYTWRWESGVPEAGETLVEVEFHERGEQTEVVVVHRGFPKGSPQGPYRLGWESGLDKLAVMLDVFAFVVDGENAPKWRSGVLDVQRVPDSGQGVGAVYRQGVRGPGGRRVAADYPVTTYQPDTLVAFRTIAGPVRPTGEFRLQETGGATTLTLSLQAELAGVKRLLMSRMVQRTMDAEVAAVDNVKRLLEP